MNTRPDEIGHGRAAARRWILTVTTLVLKRSKRELHDRARRAQDQRRYLLWRICSHVGAVDRDQHHPLFHLVLHVFERAAREERLYDEALARAVAPEHDAHPSERLGGRDHGEVALLKEVNAVDYVVARIARRAPPVTPHHCTALVFRARRTASGRLVD
eukprot:CAMPEP_0180211596 /NCGR_PEP_ID=MMETSP0987-20121128/12925_1 /TAXON_ID=697907 /ORGANISM="non described non described, Strain CCMP2293" /LENGTH=158 /DNA_ID=CAMNT_0022168955 /DNA_START=256 /DNA_END=731 /DNA_ORIENTATION=+